MNSRLLLLLDSRSPAGAHSHSAGMEAAVQAGFISTIDDVREFCQGRLRSTARVAAAFAAVACTGYDPLTLDAELDARTPSQASRDASRALGAGLRRLILATVPDCVLPQHRLYQPVLWGIGIRLAGGTPLLAARASLLSNCTAPASAAVRLLGLDPYLVHSVTAELSDLIEQIALDAAGYAVGEIDLSALPAVCAPTLDILADVHQLKEMRLFAS